MTLVIGLNDGFSTAIIVQRGHVLSVTEESNSSMADNLLACTTEDYLVYF